MRKIVCLILAVLMLSTVVFADQIVLDLSTATDAELEEALIAIRNEQRARLKTFIQLNAEELTLGVWGSHQLTAVIVDLPEGVTASPFTWSSSNPAVATINGGWLSTSSQGTAVITCSAVLSDGTELISECNVTVCVPVTSVSATTWKCDLEVGQTADAAFSVQPENATNRQLIYSSSDSSVAVVDSTGIITAVGIGSATITAVSADGSEKSASYQVSVTKKSDIGVTKTTKNNVAVTLVSVRTSTGSGYFSPDAGNVFVFPLFEIANNSSKELSFSSVLCVDVYCDDYTVSYSFTATCAQQGGGLDGTVYPGKKMKGEYGIEVPQDWKEIEVQITPELFGESLSYMIYRQ